MGIQWGYHGFIWVYRDFDGIVIGIQLGIYHPVSSKLHQTRCGVIPEPWELIQRNWGSRAPRWNLPDLTSVKSARSRPFTGLIYGLFMDGLWISHPFTFHSNHWMSWRLGPRSGRSPTYFGITKPEDVCLEASQFYGVNTKDRGATA